MGWHRRYMRPTLCYARSASPVTRALSRRRGRIPGGNDSCAHFKSPVRLRRDACTESLWQPTINAMALHGKYASSNLQKTGAFSGASRISSTPHSSASHQSSAVPAGVRSTIGITIPLHLTRSTRSLQLPSLRANSVTITVLSRVEVRKPAAALMLRAQCITSPWAFISCATGASGLLEDTNITVPARLLVCITLDSS